MTSSMSLQTVGLSLFSGTSLVSLVKKILFWTLFTYTKYQLFQYNDGL